MNIAETFLSLTRDTPRARAALQAIVSGYEQGEIRNVVLSDAKNTLGSSLNGAWEEIRKEYVYGRGSHPNGSFSWLIGHLSSLHDAISAKKKLESLKKSPSKRLSDHERYTFADVDPGMVVRTERLINAAEPLAVIVKDLKTRIVKGRAPPPETPERTARLASEHEKAGLKRTCAVCFREFAITSGGRPKRHGFSAINIRHGQSGGWHTGPCMGADYPHFGISAAGTRAALAAAQSRLAQLEDALERLAGRPDLSWWTRPSSFERQRGARPEQHTVRPGDQYEFFPKSGERRPAYEDLLASEIKQAETERDDTIQAIAFYKKKIAEWRPAEATTREKGQRNPAVGEKTFGEFTLHASARPSKSEWTIEAYAPGWRHAGVAEFAGDYVYEEDEDGVYSGPRQIGLKGWNVVVAPEYRRKGLASAMYKFAEEAFGMPIAPGVQTPEGAAFFKHRKRNGSQLTRAEDLYETFHQFEPERVGAFHREFSIPRRANHVGEAKVMYYASDKLNPETSEDEGWIHYFHEHEGGVGMHLVDDEPDGSDGDEVEVPKRIRHAKALVRLGDCEGFEYEDFDGQTVEAEGTGRLPEWYATADGKALLVIQDKRRVIAILWGGDLDVKSEGVVG